MYWCIVFQCLGGCNNFEKNSLQVMQNKAARLVTHSHLRVPRKEIFSQLGWLTVRQLIFYHTALSTYRIRQCEEPEYLSSWMSRDNDRGSIIVPNTTLSLAKDSYCYRGSTQWNTIPEHIRNSEKISNFKQKLREWILVNINPFIDS